MSARLTLVLAAALLVFRAPSLVQPMGADQALYAYVGERIRAGGLPYRDAWDQKPPAIHFLYAGLRTLLPSDGVVPAAYFIAWLRKDRLREPARPQRWCFCSYPILRSRAWLAFA